MKPSNKSYLKSIFQSDMNKQFTFLVLILVISGQQGLSGQNYGFSEQELGFDPGEIGIVDSPGPDHIEPFAIPQFRGLLRLGYQRQYYSRQLDREEFNRTGQQRKDLDFKIKDGLIQYFNLIYMDAARSTIDLNNVRKAFRPGTALEDNNAQYAKTVDGYWAIIFKGLGSKHLKPEVYRNYFCPDQNQCLPLHLPKSSASYQGKIRQARWGGGQSEFAEMRAFNDFMDKEASKFLSWSEDKTPQEVYLVGRTSLGEYNFNAGGFVLKGVKAIKSGPVLIEEQNQDKTLFKPNYQPEGQSYQSGMLISMSPEKAEKFINDLQSGKRSRQLYYVYRARIEVQFSQEALDNTDFHKMVLYFQIPGSRTIEFFSDDALTEKLFEIEN